ncbi:MAG: cupin domain-containing protein [Rhodoglobus sp.]|nr:cupin domain-containing protein [Rhodoglobus sp.]
MKAHDLPSSFIGLPDLLVTPSTTESEAAAALRVLASFNRCMVGVIRFSGETPWERHVEDELLYVVEGEVDVTVLADHGAVEATIRQGSIFVVPKGLWHRQRPRPVVSLLFLTPETGTEASRANDPQPA